MVYMDAWDGKKIVDPSLVKVCVLILKYSYFYNSYFLSLNMLAQSCFAFFFSLCLCLGFGARLQEACCCTTPSIRTQCG